MPYFQEKTKHENCTCWAQNKIQCQGHQLISNDQAANLEMPLDQALRTSVILH